MNFQNLRRKNESESQFLQNEYFKPQEELLLLLTNSIWKLKSSLYRLQLPDLTNEIPRNWKMISIDFNKLLSVRKIFKLSMKFHFYVKQFQIYETFYDQFRRSKKNSDVNFCLHKIQKKKY